MRTPTHRADIIHTPWSIGVHFTRMKQREAGARPYPTRYGTPRNEKQA